ECAAQHREANALAFKCKTRQEAVTVSLTHAACLLPDRHLRMAVLHQLRDLLQIIEAAEEGQIIARARCELLGHQLDDGRQGSLAMSETGGYLADDPHVQLLAIEGRFDI